jgi:hypothetical protein
MHKYLKNIIVLCVASCMIFAGCSLKDAAKSVLVKTYTVCDNLQQVVVKADTQQFVAIAQTIKSTLGVVNTALLYIDANTSNEKVKAAVEKAMVAINDINNVIAKLTPENVDATKAKIIASIDEVKNGLKFISDLLGVELPNTTVASNVEVKELQTNLEKVTQDLQKYLDSLKK